MFDVLFFIGSAFFAEVFLGVETFLSTLLLLFGFFGLLLGGFFGFALPRSERKYSLERSWLALSLRRERAFFGFYAYLFLAYY